MRNIVIGSRQSELALTQTHWVIERMKEANIPCTYDIQKIVTKGDKILDVTLSKVGGKGLFVKEIELALLNGEIDMAVHSLKDMPAQFPDGLIVAAVPLREDPRDCLISHGNKKLMDLPKGARVGTSSLRRVAQLLHVRPDLQVEPLRGNINTRLRKLETEGFDAIVLATAGLQRVGWTDKISERLDEDLMIPAVGQGALAIQCRASDTDLVEWLKRLEHEETRVTTDAERAFLQTLNGGCQIPIGAYATLEENRTLMLTGIVGTPDGKTILIEKAQGTDPTELGQRVAASLIAQGADQLLAQVRLEEAVE
jgi:hydroxymethylbilane synthase